MPWRPAPFAYHDPDVDPATGVCRRCGSQAKAHLFLHPYKPIPPEELQTVSDWARAHCATCGFPRRHHRTPPATRKPLYVGIDGEGITIAGQHRYILLCASTETGQEFAPYIENLQGLSTRDCLEFILSIPRWAHLFAYGFNYDITKILTDVPDRILYRLMRPELRQSRDGRPPDPVVWREYRLQLIGTHFIVSRSGKIAALAHAASAAKGNLIDLQKTRDTLDDVARGVWDVVKFYQCKFVEALRTWKVGDPDSLERMQKMKDARGEFTPDQLPEIRAYCMQECRYMATLARRLREAHIKADIPLTSFYGAGSSATAMMTKMGIRAAERNVPEAMRDAVRRAFFGGRFENRVVGAIMADVYSFDISSAYPYAIATALPCLEKGHARWRLVKRRSALEGKKTALVRYRLLPARNRPEARSVADWGPFPYRTSEGEIVYPAESPGGWVWLQEYLAGERAFPTVRFVRAWVLEQECDCRLFSDVPRYYAERLKLGKEGAGIVLKLAINSIYGKCAQSVGQPPFQSWAFAGITTSVCRAMVLDMMRLHYDRSNLLAVATDGIYTTEDISPLPLPTDTGTGAPYLDPDECVMKQKPLGAWERKIVRGGVFFARPGIYGPLDPKLEDIKKMRARGLGRHELYENWNKIKEAFAQGKTSVLVAEVPRFMGCKSSITPCSGPLGTVYTRSDLYGGWAKRPVELSFDPLPKRSKILRKGMGTGSAKLGMRKIRAAAPISHPYDRSVSMRTDEAKALKLAQEILSEQPDYESASDGRFESDLNA